MRHHWHSSQAETALSFSAILLFHPGGKLLRLFAAVTAELIAAHLADALIALDGGFALDLGFKELHQSLDILLIAVDGQRHRALVSAHAAAADQSGVGIEEHPDGFDLGDDGASADAVHAGIGSHRDVDMGGTAERLGGSLHRGNKLFESDGSDELEALGGDRSDDAGNGARRRSRK